MKKKTRAPNLFASTIMFLLCFIEQAKRLQRKEKGGAEGQNRTERGGFHPAPPPQKTPQDLVGRSEPRVKGERKGVLVPSVHSVLRRAYKQPHKRTHVRAHAGACLLEGGSDLSLCPANQRRVSAPGGTVLGCSACSSTLYKDGSNNQ